MLSRRRFTLAALAVATAGCRGAQSGAGIPSGNPPRRSRLEELAAKEGVLRVDVATGLSDVANLLESFKARYPGIEIDYRRIVAAELHTNFLDETENGHPTADILISSAMDLQFKLVNDGYAQTYESSEKPFLPDWAVWKDQAYAVTAEPIVFAYNRALMPPGDVPRSHGELADLLRRKPDAYRGKITTYDPELSGTGYLYYTQDLMLSRDTLDLVRAVGATNPTFFVTGADALNRLIDGDCVLAYNMVSSHIFVRQAQIPTVDVVFPSDYTLVMSRIAFIPKAASHPSAGKLFLDFLLSEAGQAHMARQHMHPIRQGIATTGPVPPADVLRPIRFGPSLLANLDEFRRRRVLHEWRRALES